jgi:hypothetical protein
MNKQHVTPALGSMALALAIPSGVAQTASTTATSKDAAPPPGAMEQWIKDAKNPAPWLSWGGDLRVRNEYYDNAASLSSATAPAGLHEQDVIRYRARLWASVIPAEDLSLNGRLSAEPREWMRPSFAGAVFDQPGMEWRYGIVDNLNVKYTNIFHQPLSLTAGRQDIMFGDYWNWWLVADGTPGDGSWTFFMDSVRLTYEVPEVQTKFDLVYINQNARPDGMFPTINRLNNSPYAYNLTEQNEQGVIAYASNKSIKNTTIDGYFIYKRDDPEPSILIPHTTIPLGDEANIYTAGGRVTGTPIEHVQYALEGAFQFGEKQDPLLGATLGNESRDIQAFGANGRLDYLFKDSLNNQAHLVYEYLSGDDPTTAGRDEMFDVLWGRWPRWSELYIYSYIKENGKIAQLNNIERVGAGWSIEPTKKTSFSAYYNALFAPEETPTRAGSNGALFSGDGNFRGHYLQAVLKHKFTPHISGHLWAEFVWQGGYYDRQDMMSFLRAEVLLTF